MKQSKLFVAVLGVIEDKFTSEERKVLINSTYFIQTKTANELVGKRENVTIAGLVTVIEQFEDLDIIKFFQDLVTSKNYTIKKELIKVIVKRNDSSFDLLLKYNN